MYSYFTRNDSIPDSYIEKLADLFCDMSYYKMVSNRDKMLKKLQIAKICILRREPPPGTAVYYNPVVSLYEETRGGAI